MILMIHKDIVNLNPFKRKIQKNHDAKKVIFLKNGTHNNFETKIYNFQKRMTSKNVNKWYCAQTLPAATPQLRRHTLSIGAVLLILTAQPEWTTVYSLKLETAQ